MKKEKCIAKKCKKQKTKDLCVSCLDSQYSLHLKVAISDLLKQAKTRPDKYGC